MCSRFKATDPDATVCIKEYLNIIAGEPNFKFTAYKVEVNAFSAVLKAWQDFDKDGTLDPGVYAEFFNCFPDEVAEDGSIPPGTGYTCNISKWEFEPSSPLVVAPTNVISQPIQPGFSCGWQKDGDGNWIPIFQNE
jgi:hypothetical protein